MHRESASPQRIKEAHRRILMLNHPDTGGSTYLASKINEVRAAVPCRVALGRDDLSRNFPCLNLFIPYTTTSTGQGAAPQGQDVDPLAPAVD